MLVLEMVCLYSQIGWRMLPVNGKKPLWKGWPEKATAELNVAKQWCCNPLNIGIATGQESGIVVLDIDPRNDGEESIQWLERELGRLPQTVTAKTGGGGLHYIFQYFEGAKSKVAAPGIDFLSDGKMFVAAPSIHPDTEVVYEWDIPPSERSPAELPTIWIKWLTGALSEELFDDGVIPEGNRNNHLFSLGCELRKKGVSESIIRAQLCEENALKCVPPLDFKEQEKLISSVIRYNTGNKSLKTQWQDAVMLEPTSKTQKLVLLVIASFANKDGRSCFPTQKQIATRASCTPKTVQIHCKKAEQDGWLDTYKHSQKGTVGFNYGYILKIKER